MIYLHRPLLRCLPLIALPLMLIAVPRPAAAQTSITLDSLTIQLWPEYDQPSMLVIYEGAASGTGAGQTYTFTMPPGANFHVTAYINETNGLAEVSREVSGNKVTMISPNGTFHIEFYDPALDTSKPQRSYTYTWPGDYAVDTLRWIVQQPPSALNMNVEPSGGTTQGDFGLANTLVTSGAVGQGETATLKLSYTKNNDTLTNSLLQEPSQVPAASESTSNNSTLIIAVLVLVGIALIGGGVYFYTKRSGAADHVPLGKQKSQAQTRGSAALKRFCTQCGTQALDATDKFCRNCGAPLK